MIFSSSDTLAQNISSDTIGILVINLGTPDNLTVKSLRSYLSEFLADPRVIEVPRLIWYPILHGLILRLRPKKSLRAYKRIWNYDLDESPLRTFTRSQSNLLSVELDRWCKKNNLPTLKVSWAMRYGKPSIKNKISELIGAGCTNILFLPLYPQYCAATTGSVCDSVFDALKKQRFVPAIRVSAPYYKNPFYIRSICNSIKKHLETIDFKPEVILASYHGIPEAYKKKGDPYYQQCLITSELIQKHLNLSETKFVTSFQSRFGKQKWIEPYTDKKIEQLAQSGIRSITTICPGFSSDCLETVDEIKNEASEIFYENGGENFSYIPCLNDAEASINLLMNLALNDLKGWIKFTKHRVPDSTV